MWKTVSMWMLSKLKDSKVNKATLASEDALEDLAKLVAELAVDVRVDAAADTNPAAT